MSSNIKSLLGTKKRKLALFLFSLILILSYISYTPDIALETLESKYFSDRSDYIDINGIDIHYRKEGNSHRRLLLLHGTGASLHTWDGWVAQLKDSFTVYRIDLPAFGLTGPHPKASYNLDAYVDVVNGFCRKLGLDSFSIIGNSLGGAIAWNYAFHHPENLLSMVLIDPSGYPSNSNINAFAIARNPVLKHLVKYVMPKSFIDKNIKSAVAKPEAISDEVIDRYYELALRKGNRQAFIDRANSPSENLSHRIKSIATPTLLQWGLKDAWISPSHIDSFERDLINLHTIVYPELGHIPMEEDPKSTAEDAISFLLLQHANKK